jgi:hypothetical protein
LPFGPVSKRRAISRAIASVGGGDDFLMLHTSADYSLPFKVEGYFDLRGCELADGSGVYHGYHLVLAPGGLTRRHYIEGPDGTRVASKQEVQ